MRVAKKLENLRHVCAVNRNRKCAVERWSCVAKEKRGCSGTHGETKQESRGGTTGHVSRKKNGAAASGTAGVGIHCQSDD
jgi:hypothetical protein